MSISKNLEHFLKSNDFDEYYPVNSFHYFNKNFYSLSIDVYINESSIMVLDFSNEETYYKYETTEQAISYITGIFRKEKIRQLMKNE